MVTLTVAASGGEDYTDIPDAEAAIPDNPSDDYTILVVEAAAYSAPTLNTPNSNGRALLLLADAGVRVEELSDAEGTSKARLSGFTTVSGTGWTIDGFGIIGTALPSETCTIKNCMFIGAESGDDALEADALLKTLTLVNCGFSGYGRDCVRVLGTFTANIFHCSLLTAAGRHGINVAVGATCVAKGVVVQDGTTASGNNFNGAYGGASDWNVSQDATAPGAASLTSQSGVFTNIGSGTQDLTLDGSPTVDIVDRTGFPASTDEDIAGTSRPATDADAGGYQTPAAPGGTFYRRSLSGRAGSRAPAGV
jgi:hypothetical protein